MKLSNVLLLAALKVSSAAESNGHSCACEAEEFGFEINCAEKETLLASLSFLKSSGCANDCSGECEKHYLIVQSHHDYCLESDIPQEVEDDFHDYDSTCLACDIDRIFKNDAASVDCPEPNCENNSGNDAYAALVEEGCASDCSTDSCRDNYFTLKSVHDRCDHNVLSRASEEGIHDVEDACEAIHTCNYAGVDDNQLVCDDHDGHDHEDEHEDEHEDGVHEEEAKSGASNSITAFGAALLVGLVAISV